MNNHQLTSRSTEMSQRSYPFINVSGEKIPPFAAMQIVGDPIYWKDYVARTDVQSVDKAFKKIANLSTNQFDNGMQLFCDKPSEVSELFQDASLIAFNGDSEVGVGSGGRCFYSEYPARAAIDGLPSLTNSFGMIANAWHLRTFRGIYGAFRGFCDTQQRVSVRVGSNTLQLRVANVTAYRNVRWNPSGNGAWSIDSVKKVPIATFVAEAGSASGVQFADAVVFGSNPTLTLRIPGVYRFGFVGDIQVQFPPTGVNVIPFRIGLEPYEGSDRNNLSGGISRDSFTSWNLQRYVKIGTGVDAGTVRALEASEVPEVGDEVRWARMKFNYMDELSVSTGPVRLVMWQDLSPYVVGVGTYGGTLVNEEVLSLNQAISQQASFGYYANYAVTASGAIEPPTLSGGSILLTQVAFPYFHANDAWVLVE